MQTTRPEHDVSFAAVAVQQRTPFGRPLSRAERLAVAISGTAPTHLLTIDSKQQDRAAFVASWRRLVRRLGRLRGRSRKPLIYVATIAKAKSTKGGYHVHALLWDYLHLPLLRKHVRESGLGHPQIRQLPSPHADYTQILTVSAYVLGQHEPIFGNRQFHRHQTRSKGARLYLCPQRATLKTHHPELLAALQQAQSALWLMMPWFEQSLCLVVIVRSNRPVTVQQGSIPQGEGAVMRTHSYRRLLVLSTRRHTGALCRLRFSACPLVYLPCASGSAPH